MPNPGSTSYTWTLMKNTEPPVHNRDRRMAVSYAIDRDALLRIVFFGSSEAHRNPYPRKDWAHAADVEAPGFDPDRAKRHLQAAG